LLSKNHPAAKRSKPSSSSALLRVGEEMNLDRITERIFVGSSPTESSDVEVLKSDYGITAVLNVQTDEDIASWEISLPELEAAYRTAGIELRRVPVEDFNAEELRRLLPDCVRALEELLRAGHTVFVHCNVGFNRSPSTVVAYLHWIQGMEFDEAVQRVVGSRFCNPHVEAIRLATEDREKGLD
jgi:protein-tyrosine phosphatase